MKKPLLIIVGIILLFGVVIYWSKSLQEKDPDIISRNGLHWHPNLEIVVRGEKQTIPPNVGIGGQYSTQPMGMAPVHTHDDAVKGVIHLEFSGLVRREDTTLGQFLKSWDKDITSFGPNPTLVVNGELRPELENYEMKDGDKMELSYP